MYLRLMSHNANMMYLKIKNKIHVGRRKNMTSFFLSITFLEKVNSNNEYSA